MRDLDRLLLVQEHIDTVAKENMVTSREYWVPLSDELRSLLVRAVFE